jgi:hypothetical protein
VRQRQAGYLDVIAAACPVTGQAEGIILFPTMLASRLAEALSEDVANDVAMLELQSFPARNF